MTAQTALEKAAKLMNVSINMPPFLEASKNENLIGIAEVTEKDPLPTIAQSYYFEPAFGNTALRVFQSEGLKYI
jgi:hypothetical protein